MDQRIIFGLIIFIIICIVIFCMLKKKNKDVVYHKKWIMDPKSSKPILVQTKDDSEYLIPEQVIRNMVPGMYLDKYYPKSLTNLLPYNIKKKEHFDELNIDNMSKYEYNI